MPDFTTFCALIIKSIGLGYSWIQKILSQNCAYWLFYLYPFKLYRWLDFFFLLCARHWNRMLHGALPPSYISNLFQNRSSILINILILLYGIYIDYFCPILFYRKADLTHFLMIKFSTLKVKVLYEIKCYIYLLGNIGSYGLALNNSYVPLPLIHTHTHSCCRIEPGPWAY